MARNKEQARSKNLTTYEITAVSQKHHKEPKKTWAWLSMDTDDARGITIALCEHSS